MKLVGVRPHAGRESGEARGAERGRLDHVGPLDGNAEHVGLKLHQPVVVRRAAVDAQPIERRRRSPRACVLEHVRGAVRHRLERGAHEMRATRSAREPDDRSARVGFPVRRAESRQRRHEIHAVGRLDRARQRFRLARASR